MGGEQPVSEEEIRVLLQQGAELGTFDKKNRKSSTMSLNSTTAPPLISDRASAADMVRPGRHRRKNLKDMMETTHFRLPVGERIPSTFSSKGPADLPEVLMDQHLYPDNR